MLDTAGVGGIEALHGVGGPVVGRFGVGKVDREAVGNGDQMGGDAVCVDVGRVVIGHGYGWCTCGAYRTG